MLAIIITIERMTARMRNALCMYIFLILSMMQQVASVTRNKSDKSITILPDKPYFSVIWLHGLGDSSQGFLSFFQLQQSPVSLGGRVKLLNAPLRKVTINYGSTCTSWYDIYDLSPNGNITNRFDLEQVKDSLNIIDKEITKEIQFWRLRGVTGSDQEISKRIFIGGFSQGCAMSLCYGLTSNRLLGGVIGFSGHLFEGFAFKNIDKIPMLVYHGDEDDVLNYNWVKPLYDKYLKQRPNFQFQLKKQMAHSVTVDQIKETSVWIIKQLEKYGIKPL